MRFILWRVYFINGRALPDFGRSSKSVFALKLHDELSTANVSDAYKKGRRVIFLFPPARREVAACLFLPWPSALQQRPASWFDLLLRLFQPRRIDATVLSRAVFYGRLFGAAKRSAANVTDYLSGKGKRRRENTPAVRRHGSQKKKGGQDAERWRTGGKGVEGGKPTWSRREILITTRSAQWL